MNNAVLSFLVLLGGFAQLLPGVQAPAAPQAGTAPMANLGGGMPTQQQPNLKVRVLALQAINTGEKKVDPELKGVQKLLKEMPYDTFRFVNDVEAEATAMLEVQLPINALFSFYATLLGQNEEGGINVATRIQMLEGDKFINALSAQGTLQPGKWLLYRGLPLNRGEMVMLMTLVQDKSEQDDQSSSDDEQSEEQKQEESEKKGEQSDESKQQNEGEESKNENKPEDQDKQEGEEEQQQDKPQDQNEGEEAEGEQSAQQQDAQSGEEQEAKKMEKPEIEALLDSLEEIDRREQKAQRESQSRPFFPKSGEWW